MTQYLCNVKWGFKISGSSFIPPPKVRVVDSDKTKIMSSNYWVLMFQVDAVVLKLTPLIVPKISAHYSTVEKVVKAMFQHRRKFIRKGAM